MHYLLIFLVLTFLLLSATAANNPRHRRLLHQPFFALDQTPVISQPPSSAPPPQPQQTKYPFSSPGPTSERPFFPEDSPPPPLPPPPPSSPTAFATFPANVSSLVLPSPSHSSRKTTKLVSLIVLVSLLSIFVFASLFVLLLRHRRRRDHHHDDQSLKADSLRLFPPNTPTSDTIPAADTTKKPPPPLYPCHTPSSTSSEFLHLGTLVRSRELDRVLTTSTQNDANAFAPATNYQTLGSPELLPLPPLPSHPSGHIRPQGNEEDDGDEFFSPRGSTANNATPHRTRSSHPHSNGNGFTKIGISNSSDCNSSLYSISPDNTLNSDKPVVFPAPLQRFMPPPPARQPRAFSAFSPTSTDDGGTLDFSPRSSDFGRTTPPAPRNGPPELVGPSRNVDKLRASSERRMVWDQLKSSPFQTVNSSNSNEKEGLNPDILSQENLVLDPKKSKDITMLLRTLNVTTAQVCEALVEGNADALGTELLESLLRIAPTIEEERKLMEFKDGESPLKLGPAEAFLKAVLNIPFVFRKIEAMLYVANFESEIERLNSSFDTLELACEELKSSGMFLKLLEAMGNHSDTNALKLDTLVKLADSKGADGKTILHMVVKEITNAEGLHVFSGLGGELTNVKKAASMDSKVLTNDVAKLLEWIGKIKLGQSKFSDKMSEFLRNAEGDVASVKAREGMVFSGVKNLTEYYFHGDSEAHPLRLFVVVGEFLSALDRVCKEVGMTSERNMMNSGQQVFPGFIEGQDSGSSDDESSSSF